MLSSKLACGTDITWFSFVCPKINVNFDTNSALQEFRQGIAWGEEVFRGKKRGVTEITTGHKYDWVLVPKNEEKAFCEESEVFEIEESSVPKHIDCPPLLRVVIQKDLKAAGQPVPEKIELPFLSENYIKDLEWKWKS